MLILTFTCIKFVEICLLSNRERFTHVPSMVKLLAWVSPASKSRYDWKIVKAMLILKTTQTNQRNRILSGISYRCLRLLHFLQTAYILCIITVQMTNDGQFSVMS